MNAIPKDVFEAMERYNGGDGLLNALRDAERYRWLREGDNDELVIQRQHKKVAPFLLRTEKLDAAIDAAIDAAMNGANTEAKPSGEATSA